MEIDDVPLSRMHLAKLVNEIGKWMLPLRRKLSRLYARMQEATPLSVVKACQLSHDLNAQRADKNARYPIPMSEGKCSACQGLNSLSIPSIYPVKTVQGCICRLKAVSGIDGTELGHFPSIPSHLTPAPSMYGICAVMVRRSHIALDRLDILHGAATIPSYGRSQVLARPINSSLTYTSDLSYLLVFVSTNGSKMGHQLLDAGGDD